MRNSTTYKESARGCNACADCGVKLKGKEGKDMLTSCKGKVIDIWWNKGSGNDESDVRVDLSFDCRSD
jgi:hypothetical protein